MPSCPGAIENVCCPCWLSSCRIGKPSRNTCKPHTSVVLTGLISKSTKKGKHTTTCSTLYHIDKDTNTVKHKDKDTRTLLPVPLGLLLLGLALVVPAQNRVHVIMCEVGGGHGLDLSEITARLTYFKKFSQGGEFGERGEFW